MSDLVKATAAAPAANLESRAKRIRAYHNAFGKAARDQMGYAFLCGLELNAAKAELPHGAFMDWQAKALPEISNGAAANYRAFARELVAHAPQVRAATDRLLTDGKPLKRVPTADRDAILAAVHRAAEGKTLTDLYRSLGILREPEKARHHARKMTAKEKAEAERREAEEMAKAATATLEILAGENGRRLALCADEVRRALAEACIHVGRANKQVKS